MYVGLSVSSVVDTARIVNSHSHHILLVALFQYNVLDAATGIVVLAGDGGRGCRPSWEGFSVRSVQGVPLAIDIKDSTLARKTHYCLYIM